MDRRVFAFAFSRWLRPFLALIGAGPRRSRVELGEHELVVRMGIGFASRIPRASIRSAARWRDVWWSIGVHTDLRGSWLVNGSSHGIVFLEVEPPASGRCLGVPVRVRRLGLGLEEPEAFLDALGAPSA